MTYFQVIINQQDQHFLLRQFQRFFEKNQISYEQLFDLLYTIYSQITTFEKNSQNYFFSNLNKFSSNIQIDIYRNMNLQGIPQGCQLIGFNNSEIKYPNLIYKQIPNLNSFDNIPILNNYVQLLLKGNINIVFNNQQEQNIFERIKHYYLTSNETVKKNSYNQMITFLKNIFKNEQDLQRKLYISNKYTLVTILKQDMVKGNSFLRLKTYLKQSPSN